MFGVRRWRRRWCGDGREKGTQSSERRWKINRWRRHFLVNRFFAYAFLAKYDFESGAIQYIKIILMRCEWQKICQHLVFYFLETRKCTYFSCFLTSSSSSSFYLTPSKQKKNYSRFVNRMNEEKYNEATAKRQKERERKRELKMRWRVKIMEKFSLRKK